MFIELNNFRIEEQIGCGGMATVYRAVQTSLERPVALKVLDPLHSNSAQFTRRFLNEGRMVAALSHSNIVTIHDIGVESGLHFIAMELLTGGDLKQRIRHGMPVETALQHTETIAGALGAAHRMDIVHRDVKATNVLFRADGTLVLSDFGIAKRLGGDDLTLAGSTIGSPHYLSPEQARGQAVDARADIYSLGVLLFEMLTRAKPYRGASDIDTVLMHVSEPVPRLPERFAVLQPLIDRMLAKAAADRFESTAELIAALRQVRPAWRGETAGHTPDTVLQTRENTGTLDLGFHEAVTIERAAVNPDTDFHEAVTVERAPVRPDPDGDEATSVVAPPVTATGASFGSSRLLIAGLLALTVGGLGGWLVLRASGPSGADASVQASADTAAKATPAPMPATTITTTPPATSDPVSPSSSVSAGKPPPATEPSTAADPAAAPVTIAGTGPQATLETSADPSASAQRDTRVAKLLVAADQAMEDFRLTLPAGDNALAYIEQALIIDPGSHEARAAFARIAERYVVLARSSIDKGQTGKARLFVARGLEVNPDNADLRALHESLGRTPDRADENTVGGQPDTATRGRVEGESPSQLFNRVKSLFTN